MKREELIRRGNIVTTEWSGEKNVGCYLGNGRFGAVFSGLGLNLSPEQENDHRRNRSHYNHIAHWGRFKFFSRPSQLDSCSDCIMPLYRIYWKDQFENISEYHQCHDVYDGILTTDFKTASGEKVQVVTWLDSEKRDMSGVIIDVSGDAAFNKSIELSSYTSVNPLAYYSSEEHPIKAQIEELDSGWKMTISCDSAVNQTRTELYVSTNMEVVACDDRFRFFPKAGRNTLFVSVNKPVSDECADVSLERTKAYWNNTWEKLGWIDYPDDRMQQVWVRGMAYLLSGYDSDSCIIQPTNTMGVNGFAYNFVPDMENVAPAMLMLGEIDIVKHWVEKFADEIEDMRIYAHRLWPEAEGIFPPWELNYGPMDGFNEPNAPSIFFYESHNAGYLCRMAMEALEYSGDMEWGQKYAYPLIRECAKFFRKFCFKEDDGLWHLHWYPCMGRDEAGGINKDDYLCTLTTAKYTFQAAVKCELDAEGDYQKILTEGLAFESLLSNRGTYHTCRGADDFGKQKHPVQLEAISCFPTENAALPAEKQAYKLRHDITDGAKTPIFLGWTLAQLLIADTNMKSYEDWAYDWSLLRPSNNVDEDWIQFYESSGAIRSSFYIATHGMVMQSLIRNCVNDYWGSLDIATCLPKDTAVRFGDIQTRMGVAVSGQVENGRATGTLTAMRDCKFKMNGREMSMKRGETEDFCIEL